MAVTVTPNLTLLSACDAITSWSGGTRFELDTGVKIQGTGCLADWIDATTMPVAEYAIGSSTDMSGGEHLYCWMNCSGVVDTKANGGYRLYAEDSAGNNSTWYTGGSDTHSNGWQLMVCSLDATPDLSSGTLDTSDITIIGVSFKTLTAAIKKGQTYIMNCFWDVVRYGTGLTITSGATDNITMADIFAVDDLNANKYGVVQKNYGAYIISGTLIFGNTGTGSVDMIMDNEVLLYPDNDLVSATFNTIQALGNTTGTTNFDLTGSFIKANGVAGTLDLDGANLDTINVIGSSLNNMGACDFADDQTIDSVVFNEGASNSIATDLNSCTWNTSGLITVTSTGTLTSCILNEGSGTVAVDVATLDQIDLCNFVSDGTGHAVDLGTISADDSMAWDNTESGYASTDGTTGNETILVSVNTGITLTINVATGASTPTIKNDGVGTVTVVEGAVDIDVNVKDEAGDPVPSAFVYIDEDLEAAGNITNTTTDSNGDITTASYSGAATTATLRVRLYGYKPILRTISLLTDSAINITFNNDPQQFVVGLGGVAYDGSFGTGDVTIEGNVRDYKSDSSTDYATQQSTIDSWMT